MAGSYYGGRTESMYGNLGTGQSRYTPEPSSPSQKISKGVYGGAVWAEQKWMSLGEKIPGVRKSPGEKAFPGKVSGFEQRQNNLKTLSDRWVSQQNALSSFAPDSKASVEARANLFQTEQIIKREGGVINLKEVPSKEGSFKQKELSFPEQEKKYLALQSEYEKVSQYKDEGIIKSVGRSSLQTLWQTPLLATAAVKIASGGPSEEAKFFKDMSMPLTPRQAVVVGGGMLGAAALTAGLSLVPRAVRSVRPVKFSVKEPLKVVELDRIKFMAEDVERVPSGILGVGDAFIKTPVPVTKTTVGVYGEVQAKPFGGGSKSFYVESPATITTVGEATTIRGVSRAFSKEGVVAGESIFYGKPIGEPVAKLSSTKGEVAAYYGEKFVLGGKNYFMDLYSKIKTKMPYDMELTNVQGGKSSMLRYNESPDSPFNVALMGDYTGMKKPVSRMILEKVDPILFGESYKPNKYRVKPGRGESVLKFDTYEPVAYNIQTRKGNFFGKELFRETSEGKFKSFGETYSLPGKFKKKKVSTSELSFEVVQKPTEDFDVSGFVKGTSKGTSIGKRSREFVSGGSVLKQEVKSVSNTRIKKGASSSGITRSVSEAYQKSLGKTTLKQMFVPGIVSTISRNRRRSASIPLQSQYSLNALTGKNKTGSILGSESLIDQQQKIITDVIPIQGQKSRTQQITATVSLTAMDTTFMKPMASTASIPFMDRFSSPTPPLFKPSRSGAFTNLGRLGFSKRGGIRKKYTPTLGGLAFGLKGKGKAPKSSKIFKGLEIRPMFGK
jgi:hypothetical protein